MADVDRLVAEPTPDSFRHILDLLAGVKEEAGGRTAGARLRGGVRSPWRRHSIGTGKDLASDAAASSTRTQPPGMRCSNGWSMRPGHFLRTLDCGRGGCVSALRFVGGDAGAEGIRRVGPAASCGDFPGGDRLSADPVREGGAVPREDGSRQGPTSFQPRRPRQSGEGDADYPHLVFQGNVDEEILADRHRLKKCGPPRAVVWRRRARPAAHRQSESRRRSRRRRSRTFRRSSKR